MAWIAWRVVPDQTVLRNQVLAVGRDRVDVLQHLEALEVIVAVKPHAGADDLEECS